MTVYPKFLVVTWICTCTITGNENIESQHSHLAWYFSNEEITVVQIMDGGIVLI